MLLLLLTVDEHRRRQSHSCSNNRMHMLLIVYDRTTFSACRNKYVDRHHSISVHCQSIKRIQDEEQQANEIFILVIIVSFQVSEPILNSDY
jgi:hypothetical protein